MFDSKHFGTVILMVPDDGAKHLNIAELNFSILYLSDPFSGLKD